MKSHLEQSFDPWLSNKDILQIFDWQRVFKNNYPVEVDLGAGDGGFILELAKRNPQINYVAVERLLGRIKKIVKRSIRENCTNLRALRLESFYFLKRMCPPQSLDAIYIMFPDPWPKRRHFKNRLIQPEFIAAAHQVLKPGGIVRFTTDHEDYFNWTKKLWTQSPCKWKELEEPDSFQFPLTDFQKEFTLQGRQTYRACWQKI